MRRIVLSLAMCSALFAAVPASEAGVINFDEFGNVGLVGPTIDNDYAGLGVLFSSTGGNVNVVSTQAQYNGTPPNFLCTASGSLNCTGETILDFAAPVNNVTFQGMGINDVSADVAHIDVYENGLFSGTVIVAGNAEALNPVLVDLSGFSDITKIRIYSITDGGGIGWDTFRFDAAPVPEPASLSLMGLAFAGAALRLRRASRR